MPRKKGDTPLTLDEIEKAKTLRALGRSYRRIGLELQRSDHTVKKFLTKPDVADEVSDRRETLANKFEDLAWKILEGVTPEDMQRASLLQKTTSAGIAVDKMQLLRGQATSISYTLLADFVEMVREERAGKSL